MAFKDFERSHSVTGSLSWISGIHLKISDTLQIPDKVTLPLNYDAKQPGSSLFLEYDFSLEQQVLAESERRSAEQQATTDSNVGCEPQIASDTCVASKPQIASAPCIAVTPHVNSDTRVESTPQTATVTPALKMLVTSTPTLPVNTKQAAAAVPISTAAATTVLPCLPKPSGMLTPLPPAPVVHKVEPPSTPFNPADFEISGQDPFESAELGTLNDIAELNKLQLGVLPTQQGAAQTVNHVSHQAALQSLKDVNYPNLDTIAYQNQIARILVGDDTKGEVCNSRTLPGNQTTGSAAVYGLASTRHGVPAPLQTTLGSVPSMSGSLPPHRGFNPTPTGVLPSVDPKTGSVSMAPNGVVRCSFKSSLHGSRSSPDISKEQQKVGGEKSRPYTPPAMMSNASPPEVISQVTNHKPWMHPPTSRDMSTLSDDEMRVVNDVTAMGFPPDHVTRVLKIVGSDNKQVIECLCLINRLTEQGYKMTDVESALQHLNNEESKVLQYLRLLTQFREFGFDEAKVKDALIHNDLDEDRTLDCLTAT